MEVTTLDRHSPQRVLHIMTLGFDRLVKAAINTTTLTSTRRFTMLTTVLENLSDLTFPDTFIFDLEVHIHIQR